MTLEQGRRLWWEALNLSLLTFRCPRSAGMRMSLARSRGKLPKARLPSATCLPNGPQDGAYCDYDRTAYAQNSFQKRWDGLPPTWTPYSPMLINVLPCR